MKKTNMKYEGKYLVLLTVAETSGRVMNSCEDMNSFSNNKDLRDQGYHEVICHIIPAFCHLIFDYLTYYHVLLKSYIWPSDMLL